MDRREFWKGQLVEDDSATAGLNFVIDDIENAVDRLITDHSTDGVLTGLDVTQHAPPDMTVDVSAGVAYDHEGKRCYVALPQNVDFGAIVLPAPGNEKWVSLRIDFQQVNGDPWVDDDGIPGFWSHTESYQLKLVEGLEAVIPTAARPGLHATEVLLADIYLINGMVQIVNADIRIDRREDTRWPASMISIDGTLKPWTELDQANTDLQSVMDDVDTKLIDVSPGGKIEQSLISDGNGTRDLGMIGAAWNVFAKKIEADANGDQFGTAAKRFDAFLEVATFYEHLVAGAEKNMGTDGDPFGTAAYRTFRSLIADAHGAGGHTFASAKTWQKVIPLEWGRRHNYDGTDPTNEWQYHHSKAYNPGGGAITSCMWYVNHANKHYLCVPVILPVGGIITGVELCWAQSTNLTNDMRAILQKYNCDGGITDIDSCTIDTFAAWTKDDMGVIAETISHDYAYRVRIESPDSGGTSAAAVAAITVSGTITDIGIASGW